MLCCVANPSSFPLLFLCLSFANFFFTPKTLVSFYSQRHVEAIEKRLCGRGHAEGEKDQEEDSRCQELERALRCNRVAFLGLLFLTDSPFYSAAVVAEGVARSKANLAKQELARVKAMSAAQVTVTVGGIAIVMTLCRFSRPKNKPSKPNS